MKSIILDTNIILRHPKLLGLKISGVDFLIPLDVIEELNTRANLRGVSYDKRIDLIQKAGKNGNISIVNTDQPVYRQLKEKFRTNGLSSTDLSILALAVDLKVKGDEVKIATLDKEIIISASANGIPSLNDTEIEHLIRNFSGQENKSSPNIKDEIISYEKDERNSFVWGWLVGVLFTVVVMILYKYVDRIVSTINVWGTVSLTIISGIFLFVFRERKRFSYGVVEFLVGILAIIVLFQPDGFDFSKVSFNFEFTLKILAGLYIMVRGQDNMVKATKDTKIGLYLKDKWKIGI